MYKQTGCRIKLQTLKGVHGYYNFFWAIKGRYYKDTTGTTVGTNVANVGYSVMAQSAVLDIAGATTTTTIGYVPANSQVISVVLSVTTAK
jgi:hypothetical protein